jgi:hypothetical protein
LLSCDGVSGKGEVNPTLATQCQLATNGFVTAKNLLGSRKTADDNGVYWYATRKGQSLKQPHLTIPLESQVENVIIPEDPSLGFVALVYTYDYEHSFHVLRETGHIIAADDEPIPTQWCMS